MHASNPHRLDAGEQLSIDNAGLVLTGVFLPTLFQQLAMLHRDEAGRSHWRDEAAAGRAVHLTQYLVDGRTDAPAPRLTLNKILCGIPLAAPVPRAIEMSETERETCTLLLRSLLGHWSALGGTSIEGLRETFLQREGRLQHVGGAWKLVIPRKPVDVLVDRIGWSFASLHHPWMPEPVHVGW
jgi:hypothetical protein